MPHGKPLATALIVLGCMLALSGCGTVKKDSQVNALQGATNAYDKTMRWGHLGYFENAMGYLHPDTNKSEEAKKIKEGLRITGFDDVSPPAIVGEGKATQVVMWEYLYDDRQVVKKVLDRQSWEWDPELKTWWLTSGLPAFE